MSEHQYYEFLAIDRPLSESEMAQLRRISTRAEINPTSFINVYNWGDFRGDETSLMKNYFDLHLYRANWATSRFMVRLPKRFVDQSRFDDFLRSSEVASLIDAGENMILDVFYFEDGGWYEFDDGLDRLSPFIPLRYDLIGGDLRMLYIIWLVAVEDGSLREEVLEPLPGLAPLSGALKNFAKFLRIDSDLIQAAAERNVGDDSIEESSDSVLKVLSAIPESKKTKFLQLLYDGDPHASIELRAFVRKVTLSSSNKKPARRRSVLELRDRAEAIRIRRKAEEAARAEAKRKQVELEKKRAQRREIDAIVHLGLDNAWDLVEDEINRRNRDGYNEAAKILSGLKYLSKEDGTARQFEIRLSALKRRHPYKKVLLEILNAKFF